MATNTAIRILDTAIEGWREASTKMRRPSSVISHLGPEIRGGLKSPQTKANAGVGEQLVKERTNRHRLYASIEGSEDEEDENKKICPPKKISKSEHQHGNKVEAPFAAKTDVDTDVDEGISTIHEENRSVAPEIEKINSERRKQQSFRKFDHYFVEVKRSLFRPCSSCIVCKLSLGTGTYLQCTANYCKIQIHQCCKENAPLPCVPIITTPKPKKTTHRYPHRLADVCPSTRPYVPGQLTRVVLALDQYFLRTVALYLIDEHGTHKQIDKLAEKLESKYTPRLELERPNILTDYVKNFLAILKDPLIPSTSYQEFLNAVKSGDEQLLKSAIEDLPASHLDTLAYLCAHWQRVAENAQKNIVTLDSLAAKLGPIVCGQSTQSSECRALLQDFGLQDHYQLVANQKCEIHQQENKNKYDIMLALLKIDHNYWTNICGTYNASVFGRNTRRRSTRRVSSCKQKYRLSKTPSKVSNKNMGQFNNNATPGTSHQNRRIQPLVLSNIGNNMQ